MNTVQGTVLLIQNDKLQESLLSTAFLSNNITVRKIKPDESLLPQLHTQLSMINGRVLICADLARLAKDHLVWPQFAHIVKGISKDIGLLANNSKQLQANTFARLWVKKHGGLDLVGSTSPYRLNDSIAPVLDAIHSFFGIETNTDRLRNYADALLSTSAIETEDPFAKHHRTWARLEALNQSPEDIAESMSRSDQVRSEDRTFRLKKYPNCFLGSDAAKWLEDHLGLSSTQALEVGELLRAIGHLYHVAKEQPFLGSHFYYRFSLPSQNSSMIDIDRIIEEGHLLRGFDIQDRKWRGKTFPKTFVGSEATKWLASFYTIGTDRALYTGQILLDLHIFRHVADEHDFINGEFFYRLTRDKRT